MTFARALPGQEAAVEAILAARPTDTMFARANLSAHGLSGAGGPHATRYWTDGRSVVALTAAGMLLPCLAEAAAAPAAAAALAGERITGATGPAAEVRALLAALDLTVAPCLRDADEPGFAIDLAALRMPPPLPDATLLPATAADGFLTGWRAAYHVEVLGTPVSEAGARAQAEISACVARGSHRVLRIGDTPVAFTGFNAILPDIVQVGGVYVPPALRGRGHARRAVALHLAEARQLGTARACLFAASAAAARSYLAIGFRPAPPVALVLFDRARVLSGAPA